MSAHALLAGLRSRGVELVVDGDKLRWRAPAGVLTAQDKAALAVHRAALLRLLAPRPGAKAGQIIATTHTALVTPCGCGRHGVVLGSDGRWRCAGCRALAHVADPRCGHCGARVALFPEDDWPGFFAYECMACRHCGWHEARRKP